jgi:signal transduction histidine kinase
MTTPRTKRPSQRAMRATVASVAEKRLERRCETLRRELDILEHARAELCSVLSHDLRNPLTVVVWSGQVLARALPPGDPARRHVDTIARATEEMNQILFDLSDVARIVERRLGASLAIEPGAVGALVEQAIAPNRGLVQSKEIALAVDVAPGLRELHCDRERVSRLLSGLVGSAARRTPKHGTVAVRVAGFVDVGFGDGAPIVTGGHEGLRVTVEDAGPDIPAEDRAALFALPVAPLPGAPRRPRTQAVSLYVARGIIEAHGGRMWLEGRPDRGSRFVFTLPWEPSFS